VRAVKTAARGFGQMVARKNFLAVDPRAWKKHCYEGRNAARIRSEQEGVDDVKVARAIGEYLAMRHQIDCSRVFAAGVSYGGIFATAPRSTPRTFSWPSPRFLVVWRPRSHLPFSRGNRFP
jgi:poly(3-hydroxybutyrate) depolymerase